MSKYRHVRRRRRPVFLVYLLALAAVVMAVLAFIKFVRLPGVNNDALLGGRRTEQTSEKDRQSTKKNKKDKNADAAEEVPEEPVKTENELAAERAALLEECDLLRRGYFYDEAIAKLANAGELRNDETAALLSRTEKEKSELTPYTGDMSYHVFFHSLIVDTSKAFDGDYQEAGYNMYMTTVSEFKKMLPLLEANDFVLYDITDMVELVDGQIVEKEILLPPGKKPLVLSIDDVNYYEYMKPDGFADRLDVDADGNVVTIVKDADGNDTVTYDGDVMPILDAYVREHPEFSWRGAKGIVATTGYQGAFGYRITDLEDYDEATQKWMLDKVTEVAKALRATGWQIANHSYTHNQYWNNKTMTMEQCRYDVGRWVNEIMPYVGETHIFISPFGVIFDKDDERYQHLLNNGFYIYCPVDSRMTHFNRGNSYVQGRLNLDGITMMKYPERISKYYFDPALVLDPARPPMD